MFKVKIAIIVAILCLFTGAVYWRVQSMGSQNSSQQVAADKKLSAKKTETIASKTDPAKKTDSSAQKTNSVSVAPKKVAPTCTTKTIVVSISQQHMWGYKCSSIVYDTAVTTGATNYGDGTPTGTWAITSKQTDRYLTGSDSRGSWNDHVNYWIPYNGDYGFHDATWQTMSFGDSDYVNNGSHGCVRLPLSAADWLYKWAPVGTAVKIKA